ncbi:flagellar hook-basal body subfamily protein [Entamoeba histolytica HM-1:IMSS-B]|uniref:Flagellar hook protein FlgE n=1 Tax=Entamoeba histolytica HM-1:IMSS-B TaxID=885319 RepID=M3TIY8_ENTH1|nr:flagellar hook-basal body subfamily protein [Entamoeba histolytica HM-1:IMSS-B]
MSFNIGLSGIKAASSDLNITGNNIANASTVGFKQSRAEFQDLYAASVLGTGKNAQGSGVLLGNVGQLFNQGTIDSTQNALDMGINGNGFFVTSNNGAIQYTRAGYFGTDKQGFIVDNNGYRLQGYTTNDQGLLQPGVRSDLRIETASQAPKASSSIKQTVNLNSTQTTPTTTPFNPSDPTSYNSSTSVNIYDSQGNAHVLSQYFVKGANNSWTMNVLIDGRNPGDPTKEDATTKVATPYTVTLPFTSSGALDGANVASTDLKQVNNATTNTFEGVLKLDNWVPAISNGGTPATCVNQDGYTTGQLSGLEIDDTGQIFARYTNGQSKVQGQVVLANFANVQGLTPMGKTSWTESSESGQPVVGTPRAGTLGALQSGALEASNVDISTQLVNMIVAQRNYQANAKTIETENAITQTIINLR